MTGSTAPDWALIERLYREGSMPLTQIASRCGVAPSTISRHAHSRGWPARRTRRGRASGSPGPTLKERLIIAMERKLRHIEERLEEGSAQTRAESERETRELGSVSRHLERLGAIATATGSPSPACATPTGSQDDDAERWRHEIAERLERIKERLEGR